MQYEHLNVAPMAGCLGAEISGVDLRNIDEATFAEIMQAFVQYKAIFFRDQDLTPEQHIAFSQGFGPAQIDKFIAAHPHFPELMQLLKEADNKGRNFGGSWHSDTSYLEQPPIGVSLYALDVPPFGGDTIWVDMEAVYEALSDTYKQMLLPLQAEHLTTGEISKRDLSKGHYGQYFNDEYQEQSINTAHPMVCQHPISGKPCLFVNEAYVYRIAGMSREESQPIIDHLCEFAKQPHFQCRFHWTPNTLAIWDNRNTQHFAINDYTGQRREMHRYTIAGAEPIAYQANTVIET